MLRSSHTRGRYSSGSPISTVSSPRTSHIHIKRSAGTQTQTHTEFWIVRTFFFFFFCPPSHLVSNRLCFFIVFFFCLCVRLFFSSLLFYLALFFHSEVATSWIKSDRQRRPTVNDFVNQSVN